MDPAYIFISFLLKIKKKKWLLMTVSVGTKPGLPKGVNCLCHCFLRHGEDAKDKEGEAADIIKMAA